MGCTTSTQTASYSQANLKLPEDVQTFCLDQLLIEEVLFIIRKLIDVHSAMGLFKKDKTQRFEVVRTEIDVIKRLYNDCTNENDQIKTQSHKTKPQKHSPYQLNHSSQSPSFPSRYFEHLSLFFKNRSQQAFIPLSNFIQMYSLFTKLPIMSQHYSEVLFSFLSKGQPYLASFQFKHFLSAINLDTAQLQNLLMQANKTTTRKPPKQQSTPPIFVLPTLIQQKQFTQYLKPILTSQSHSKSLSAFQQSFSLLKNTKLIFDQYFQLKQLLIEQQINETRNYGQQVFIVSKKWFDTFLKLFHKIYDTKVIKADKHESKSNFIKLNNTNANINTNHNTKSTKKDKKHYSSTQLKTQEITQTNRYVLLRSQFIDNSDIEGEYQLELKEDKNPQLNFKVLSQQLHTKIQHFLLIASLKWTLNSNNETNNKKTRIVQYKRKVLQGNSIEYNPVLVHMIEVNKKGHLNQQTARQLLLSSNMTLKQLKTKSNKFKQQQSLSFFVKYFQEKNFRQQTNDMTRIKELTTKNMKLIIAITTNRVAFIEENSRKQKTKENLTIGDKLYAYSQRHQCLLPAYVLGKRTQSSQVKVHFINKSWHCQTWVKTQSTYLQNSQFQDQTKRPPQYLQSFTGLLNVGNTCYINSSIQSLLSTTIFSTLLQTQPMSTKLFSFQLQSIFSYLSQPPNSQKMQIKSLKPSIEVQFKRNMTQFFKQFTHWQQQDTQEFIHAVLDKISQEQKLFIEKIFRFWIQNELVCSSKTCNGRKVNKQAMSMITLPIPEPKQIYVQIIFVPIYRDKLQKLFIKLHQQATLVISLIISKGQLLRKFQQRTGIDSHRVVMVEIDNGVLKGVRPEMTQSFKDRDSISLKQLGIVANYNLAAYEVIKQQKINDLVKRNNTKSNQKKQFYDFYIKQLKQWTIAKIPKLTTSMVSAEYLTRDLEKIETKIPKAQIDNKTYVIQSLGAKTLQSQQFHVKLFMRKLVQSPVNTSRLMQNFGFPFMTTLPIWCSYNDAFSIIYEQIQNVLTKAQNNEHYTVRFMQAKRQKCIFCEQQLSRVYPHNEDVLKRCCKVLQPDAPILFLTTSKSFTIYIDWKSLNYYNSSFVSGLGMDRACKATQQQFKQQKVSLCQCFNMLRIKQEVQMTCETCKHPKMYRQQSISTLPPVLIIQLKQYRFVNEKEAMVKLNTNLRYEEVRKIDIEPYMPPNSLLKQACNFSPIYQLYSVIQHVGSGNSGHYTAICKRKLKDIEQQVWVFFDDNYSQILDQTKVQNYLNNAYMLFYRKQYLGVDAKLSLNLI